MSTKSPRRAGARLRSLAAALLVCSAAALAEPVSLELQAQPLSAALREFARQTGIQVAIQSALTEGKTAPGLAGKYEPAAALAMLLEGTGLAAYPVNENTYGIRQIGALAPATTSMLDEEDPSDADRQAEHCRE
jgi:type II secretory pathway component GspD/PulD (secretin)